MKILLVTNMYPSGDMPFYGIFVKEQENAICKEYPNVHYTIAYINGKNKKYEYLTSIFKIRKLIKRNDFDLIHVHYGFSGLFLLLGKLPKKIPVLITLHGGDIQVEQGKKIQVWFTKQILKKSHAAITLNTRMNNIVQKYVHKTEIIPCSVNTDTFYPPLTSKKNNLKDELHIIFPSDKNRLVKNYPLFEQTISILRGKYNLRCRISEIKNMSRAEVSELYRNADLMILTSISEGSPQVIKEAMACNLPIVSTNVGDVAFLLNNVSNSAISSNMEAEELAYLANKVLNGEIHGISGREKIFQLHLDDKSIAQKIYNTYLMLISRF